MLKHKKLYLIIISLHILSFSTIYSKKVKFPFYIYKDFGAIGKLHFFPSGRIGDIHTLRLIGNYKKNPYSGKSCIRIIYDTSNDKVNINNWAGIFWQYPANNWGTVPNVGYNLTGAQKLIFYAKGAKGEETVSFSAGGINGKYGDSGASDQLSFKLTKKWKKYEIPLDDILLNYIIGGFTFVLNSSDNPDGATFDLDDIYFEN